MAGLRGLPDSRGLGEYLGWMTKTPLEGLLEAPRLITQWLGTQVVWHWRAREAYVPVFVDGTGIKVSGTRSEGAQLGYNGERKVCGGRPWLHGVSLAHVTEHVILEALPPSRRARCIHRYEFRATVALTRSGCKGSDASTFS